MDNYFATTHSTLVCIGIYEGTRYITSPRQLDNYFEASKHYIALGEGASHNDSYIHVLYYIIGNLVTSHNFQEG